MADNPFELRVESTTGHGGEAVPQRFCLGERCIEVRSVIDRWLDPEHHYFKLQGSDGGLYILRHDVPSGRWELTLFDARGDDGQ